MANVKIVIDSCGKVTFDVTGSSGPACFDLTKDIENALGSDKQVTEKPEARGRMKSVDVEKRRVRT